MRPYHWLQAILLSTIILGQVTPATADTVIKTKNNIDTSKPEISFSLTPGIAFFFYKEYVREENNKAFMDITGPLYGIETSLRINLNPKGIIGLTLIPFDIAFYGGTKLNYKSFAEQKNAAGQFERYLPYGSLNFANEQMFLFWYRTLAGPSFNFLNDYRISLLSGYGYKYTLARTTEDPSYGDRQNLMSYVPLAMQFQYKKDHLDIIAHAEYDIFLGGLQKTVSVHSVTKVPYNVEHRQPASSGRGARASLEISYYGATIAPFFNYFWIDDSEPAPTESVEPRNVTIETGAKIGYKF
ncbi:MAG: hypothetical protein ORN57_02625 [Alphaproteobacteria bacterium]|nr:hypothetical protein [Alphaproteobacteria bacterium]